jgi:hypothetical protein
VLQFSVLGTGGAASLVARTSGLSVMVVPSAPFPREAETSSSNDGKEAQRDMKATKQPPRPALPGHLNPTSRSGWKRASIQEFAQQPQHPGRRTTAGSVLRVAAEAGKRCKGYVEKFS